MTKKHVSFSGSSVRGGPDDTKLDKFRPGPHKKGIPLSGILLHERTIVPELRKNIKRLQQDKKGKQ